MKIRARVVVLVTAALFLTALIVVPRIIEAKRAGAVVASQPAIAEPVQGQRPEISFGASVRNDTSKPVREMKQKPMDFRPEREANVNPHVPHFHKDAPDRVIQKQTDVTQLAAANMPSAMMNFNGIQYPGVACNCAPPDTVGEVGATQYVQMVNEGFQVFDKNTGASLLGPSGISTIWQGLGGVCETAGSGDPVVLYDQIAGRWIISQFAGSSVPTDECVA